MSGFAMYFLIGFITAIFIAIFDDSLHKENKDMPPSFVMFGIIWLIWPVVAVTCFIDSMRWFKKKIIAYFSSTDCHCMDCGNKNPAVAKFCRRCGKSLISDRHDNAKAPGLQTI